MAMTSAHPSGQGDEVITYCARHPEIETELRCSRCETLICPRCLIQTAVGARCKDCAAVRKNPIYTVTPAQYALMIPVSVLGGALVGVAWAFIQPGQLFLGFFSLFVAAGVGWLMAKAVERAASYRRGLVVQAFAIAGILTAFLVRGALIYDGLVVDGYGLIALGVACFVAYQNLK
ncbi:MAG TPA: hypothetical protein VFZ12_00940 [Dehalococcoidia bacterium]|nr:hypothetical protein [Dehalococcoidia bacterium]